VTPGDSNAGKGGRGDNGVVYVRYAAFAEPAEVLPYTGRNSRGLAALALTMIGLGGATTAFARRRRTIA
jgi:LPXTG-motif cell wall-anchored protein